MTLPTAAQARVLAEALARARAGGVAVFDLESTVFDNRPRQARILAEFGAARGIAALAGARPEHWTSWSITRAMQHAGLDAGAARALALEARAFWRERFFTSDYCTLDVAIAGAAEFLDEIRAAGARIVYLTGRHEGMRAGTVAAMHKCTFPVPDGDGVRLLMKPALADSDDDFKRATAPTIREVFAAFDNEPAHVCIHAAAYRSKGGGALVVHVATDDSGRPIAVPPGVPSILDFTRAGRR